MSVSPNTQAILLLTAYFSKAKSDGTKPLTPKEWGRFAVWLNARSHKPESLMTGSLRELLQGWSDKTVTPVRIESLLARGAALALAMEKWLRAGLWVMTRSDLDYPKRLKKRLGPDSPAVLFGCGNRDLLDVGGLAVVGSRTTSEDDFVYSRELGAAAAQNGISIVSGGAKGVDESAMLGALEVEGTVIGVLVDSLLRASSSARYRSHLMSNNLVLVSSFYPEAGFNVGNAMQRNKYIFCLADAAIVVHSGTKGGTWNGAQENLKKQWVPLWVKETNDINAGNAAIVKGGGAWVPSDVATLNFSNLFRANSDIPVMTAGLFDEPSIIAQQYSEPASILEQQPNTLVGPKTGLEGETSDVKPVDQDHSSFEKMDLYGLFLTRVEETCSESSKSADELATLLCVNKTQLNSWLKRAVGEKKLMRSTRPVRYSWVSAEQGTLAIFDE